MASAAWPPSGGGSAFWGDAVNTSGDLPATGAVTGECRLVLDTDDIYEWNGLSWEQITQNTADVTGPASSTDNAVARFDLATGKVLQNSGVIIDDSDNITGVASINTITATELSYLDNATSEIQSQLDAKLDDVSVASDNQVARFDADGTALQSSGVTIDDSDNVAGVASLNGITATEIGYLDNATSEIQSQLDAKLDDVAGASDNEVPRFDTNGETLQSSGVTIDDSDNVSGINNLNTDGHVEAGDPGLETAGVNINGVTYAAGLRVNDIGGSTPAEFVIHKHSTTLQPVILGARSNSNTTAHANVTNGMGLLTLFSSGWTGSHYDLFASIDMLADTTGTISSTSSPGKLSFKVTANGSNLPTEAMAIANNKATTFAGAVNLNADPTTALQAATKQYVDGLANGVKVKQGAKAKTTGAITLSGEQTVDGVALTDGDICLVTEQGTDSENGLYEVSTGSWSRTEDFNSAAEANQALVTVAEGSTYANTGWYQYEEVTTLNSDSINFNQFFGAGTYAADGEGLELSGSTFSLELDGSTLVKSASGLKVNGVTATELGYLSGVTSSVQTQLNAFRATQGNVSVSSDVTLTDERIHFVDTTAARSLTLPAASATLYLVIKDVSGSASTNNITVNTPGAETIDGGGTYVVNSDYASVTVVSDGTNYFIV